MQHHFDTELACKYGLFEAILLNHFEFWIEQNEKNNKNFYDGRYWTYNSMRAFSEIFPYMSERKIRNALKHLEEEGILVTGNYNKSSYDRTLWYAFSDFGKSILQKCQMEVAKMSNGSCKNVRPIPDNNHIDNTDNIPDISVGEESPNKPNGVSGKENVSVRGGLFDKKPKTRRKKSKAETFLEKCEKVSMEFDFSDLVLSKLDVYFNMLAEVKSFLAEDTIRSQLSQLADYSSSDTDLAAVIDKTVLHGWKSLNYAIEGAGSRGKFRDTAYRSKTKLFTEEEQDNRCKKIQEGIQKGTVQEF